MATGVKCLRKTEILVGQQPPQGVFVCDHAGLAINTFSTGGAGAARARGWSGQDDQCKATWEREFKLSWHEAGPLNHLDSDQEVVNQEVFLSAMATGGVGAARARQDPTKTTTPAGGLRL